MNLDQFLFQTSVSSGKGLVTASSFETSTSKGFMDKSTTSSVWADWSQAEGTLSASILSFEGSSESGFESSVKKTMKLKRHR